MEPHEQRRVHDATAAYIASLEKVRQLVAREPVSADDRSEWEALSAEVDQAEQEYKSALRAARFVI